MKSRQNTNPWADVANQAIGAMYKHYASQPTVVDQMKMQLQQEQLRQAQLMNNAGAYPGMPGDLQLWNARQKMSPEDQRALDLMRHPYEKFEGGDVQGAFNPSTGSFDVKRTIGAPPRSEVDKEGGGIIPVPAIPSQPIGAADLFGAYGGQQPAPGPRGFTDVLAEAAGSFEPVTQNEMFAPQPRMKVNPPPLNAGDPMSEWQGAVNGMPQSPTTGPAGGTGYLPIGMSPNAKRSQDRARASVSDNIAMMANALTQLKNRGAAVSTDQKGLTQNLPNYLASTGIGQEVGKAFGTEEQSLRNNIITQKPAIMGAIMQATGMSAKQMDSNRELQFYLNTMGDPTMDVQASLAALQVLNDTYGLGADRFADPAAVEQIRQKAKQALQPVQGQQGTVQIQSHDEYNALPRGTHYIDPNGVKRIKQ